MKTPPAAKLLRPKGFTLIEILVVVTVIGLLAAIAIPAFAKAKRNATATRLAADIRKYAENFERFAIANGDWPEDVVRGVVPTGMEDYLNSTPWTQITPIGGNWDYDAEVIGVRAAISINGHNGDPETLARIDALIDDGNLYTGALYLHQPDYLVYRLD